MTERQTRVEPEAEAPQPGKKKQNRGLPSRGARKSPAATKARASREDANFDREDATGLEMTVSEREGLLRDQYLQSSLPNPPRRPGIHWFWASLENKYNPVKWYLRLGYQLVRYTDLPGFADASMRQKGGEYDGCVCCNEMILLKVSEEGYQQIMRVVHHEKPNEEAARLRNTIDQTKEVAGEDRDGRGLVKEIGDGMKTVDRRVKAPARFEG